VTTELERAVTELTIEVRELVARLGERCPNHDSEIQKLWAAVRALGAKVWGVLVLILGTIVGLYATHVGGASK
jgi:hypothetical protein